MEISGVSRRAPGLPTRRACLALAGLTAAGSASLFRRRASASEPATTAGATTPSPAGARPQPRAQLLQLQPFGPVPPRQMELITAALGAFFDFRLQVLPERPMPTDTYYPPRRRHRAERILQALMRQSPERIMAVTALDISTTKEPYPDWGIMGLGDIGGRAAVVSSFRCRRRAPSVHAGDVRLAKVAVHELGHTLGLPHCPNRGCLMEDANGSVLTTDHEIDFCATCRARLAANGFVVRPAFAWP